MPSEGVFICEEFSNDWDEAVMVEIMLRQSTFQATTDSAACSVWVSAKLKWTVNSKVVNNGVKSVAADGREMHVVGSGVLDFSLWGCLRTEEIMVTDCLLSIMLIEKRLWKKHGLTLSFSKSRKSIVSLGSVATGPMKEVLSEPYTKSTCAFIEDSKVDIYTKIKLNVSKFSENITMKD